MSKGVYTFSTFDCMKCAIISHNIDFVSFLMNEYNIQTKLLNCVVHNNIQAFLAYLDQTKNINKCFIESPGFNLPPLCEYLFSKGADINAKDESGQTALFIAVRSGNAQSAEFLISQGAEINARDKSGQTALFIAARSGNAQIAEFLISQGAEINARDDKNNTPLFEAAISNDTETIRCLLAHGADVNAINFLGYNPLFYLLKRKNNINTTENAEIFFSYGVDFNLKNNDGKKSFMKQQKFPTKLCSSYLYHMVLIFHQRVKMEKQHFITL